MGQFLDLPPADQRLVIEQTAARVGWIASSVEKDFWVSWTLQQLFAMPDLAPHLTFKGGISGPYRDVSTEPVLPALVKNLALCKSAV